MIDNCCLYTGKIKDDYLGKGMKILDRIALILLLIGGLTWGGVGVADFNMIMWVFIAMHTVQHIFYTAFGIAAIWLIVRYFFRKKSS